jgi:histone-lysine N-methyltransferase SETMAR
MIDRFDSGAKKSVFDIITGDETWIYTFDPETKKQSTVWCFPDDTPLLKAVRSRSSAKTMIAAFFCKSGYVTTVPLTSQRTVTAN